MSTTPIIPSLVPPSSAQTRAADVLLRAVGGRSVMLRTPAPAVAADPTEQLGIATPTFQDTPLAPVVFRRANPNVSDGKAAHLELFVSATAIQQIVGSLAYSSANVLFASAYGVLCDDKLLEIVSATADQIFGQPYVYRLALQAPQNQIV